MSPKNTGNAALKLESVPAVVGPSVEEQLAALRAENAALKAQTASKLTFKVSEKGALSVYGMGRFPVTLYKEQWGKLFAMADNIKAFIQANDTLLKAKT